jgi:predicted flap endonuclease-1-like 5' DNA nuclease
METLYVILILVFTVIVVTVILSLSKRKEKVMEPIVEEAIEREVELTSSPLEKIKGIGPRYKQKLVEVGVQSIEDIIKYENRSGYLAEELSISKKRIVNWIEQAKKIAGTNQPTPER